MVQNPFCETHPSYSEFLADLFNFHHQGMGSRAYWPVGWKNNAHMVVVLKGGDKKVTKK